MDREFHIRFTLSDVLKLLLASPVVVVFVFGIFALPWGSKDAPAWVQAIGSVVAIAIAIAVPYMQRRHALEAKGEEDLRIRSNAYNATISLIDSQIRLFNRCALGWGWMTSELPNCERLVSDLFRNQRQIESLSLDSLGGEMIAYLLMIKEIAGFGGHFASVLEVEGNKMCAQLRVLGLEAVHYVLRLEEVSEEISEKYSEYLLVSSGKRLGS